MGRRTKKRLTFRPGFTLIELLVVITVIALLIGLLLPALSGARNSAVVSTCQSRQHQLMIGANAYASDAKGNVPRGPEQELLPGLAYADFAYNVIWLPPTQFGGDGALNAHGVLLDGYLSDPRATTCPGAPSIKPSPEELEEIGSSSTQVIVSYMYRNLDETTNDQIDDMGKNSLGGAATALVFDLHQDIPLANPLGVPQQRNLNHQGTATNAAYSDGHVESLRHDDDLFMFRESDYTGGFGTLLLRADNILIRLDDVAGGGDPLQSTQLP